MKYRNHLLIIFLLFFFFLPRFVLAKIDTVSTAAQLYNIVALGEDSLNIVLMPGDYHLEPNHDIDTLIETYGDTTLGPVKITYGLKITSSYVNIKGAPAYTSAIYTNAGYGLWFVGCKNASIEGLIITGGQRDTDSRATNAAIVA